MTLGKKALQIIAAIGLGFLSGCGSSGGNVSSDVNPPVVSTQVKDVTSEIKHDIGVVVDRSYIPAHLTPSVSPTVVGGNGYGMGADGHWGVSTGGVTISNRTVPNEYSVTISWNGSQYSISGTGREEWQLFNELHIGDKVDVSYKEISRETYKDTNGDGIRELVDSTLLRKKYCGFGPENQ